MTTMTIGQSQADTHLKRADVIHEIQETYRERVDFLREENALTLRIKARLRRALEFTGYKLSKAELAQVNALYKAMLGHPTTDTQTKNAEQEADHVDTDAQWTSVGSDEDEGDQITYEAQALTVALVVQMALSNARFLEARAMMHADRLALEKRLTKLAKSLPVYPWVDGINGFGALGLAIIVGIAGDLSNYANPAKVWKRFGLAVMDGKAQRKVADVEKAVAMGYSPVRRSAMWTIGDSLLKKQNVYREIYLDRKVYELERSQNIVDTHSGSAPPNEPERSQGMHDTHHSYAPMTKMHAHRRAQRYAEKRLLRDLWRQWQTTISLLSMKDASATEAA